MLKKILILSLVIVLLNARVVVDSEGKEVKLPDTIERATPITGVFVQIALALGNEDKIISGAYRGLSPMLLKAFPQIKTTGFSGGSLNASVETLISSKTQVVFGPASVLFDDNVKKQLERTGIVVVRLISPATPQDLKDMVTKTGEIFGDESIKRAKEFNTYYDENIAFVRSRIPKNAYKKRVLILSYRSGGWVSTINNYVAAEYVRVAGAENLSNRTGLPGVSPSLNEEQIIVYNPDVIIVTSMEALEQILKNPSLKELKAIKNGQIFIQPRGIAMYLWTGTEGALQVLWLAKILHPNEFKDLNLESKVREFYERFYHYKLSDDELKEILNPKEKIKMVY